MNAVRAVRVSEARGLSASYDCARGQTVENAVDSLFREAYAHGLSLYSVCYINCSHQQEDIDEALSR